LKQFFVGGTKMVARSDVPKHTGVPSFFRACCREAGQGGTNTYRDAGWHLAIHLCDQSPYEIELDDWQGYIEKLKAACEEKDEIEVWEWFHLHYPKCMSLVPKRRKRQFVAGVLAAYVEGRV
jgi:hypothetical protein